MPVDAEPWVEYVGNEGPGKGKRIVFITGDEEYRSEEAMPQLARILAYHHGFSCRVCFAVDPKTGMIDPMVNDNIPGTEALAEADLLVIYTRFRDLPDEQMKPIVDFVESGKPVVGLRTSTHAFLTKKHKKYESWSTRSRKPRGGFGRNVLGETWIAHHGGHGRESSRGIRIPHERRHPILRGIDDKNVWCPGDVYRVRLPMLDGVRVLMLGEVLAGMKPDSPTLMAKEGPGLHPKNEPRMPMVWTRIHESKSGKKARVFATTMGASQAFTQAGSRRLLVQACYWALGLEKKIPKEGAKVELCGRYTPTRFGFKKHQKGVRPVDLRWAPGDR